MNFRGKYYRKPLQECRVCGMDSGLRMVAEAGPERFFVVCQLCGHKTKPHTTQSAASKEWNGGGH